MLTEEIARKWFSLNQQVQYYRNELEKRGGAVSSFDHIISGNPKFNKMKKDAQRIARSSSTVLLINVQAKNGPLNLMLCQETFVN